MSNILCLMNFFCNFKLSKILEPDTFSAESSRLVNLLLEENKRLRSKLRQSDSRLEAVDQVCWHHISQTSVIMNCFGSWSGKFTIWRCYLKSFLLVNADSDFLTCNCNRLPWQIIWRKTFPKVMSVFRHVVLPLLLKLQGPVIPENQ